MSLSTACEHVLWSLVNYVEYVNCLLPLANNAENIDRWYVWMCLSMTPSSGPSGTRSRTPHGFSRQTGTPVT